MKYFIDTEFIETETSVELVSLGIVSENGDTFYAESRNFDPSTASEWVKENVIEQLHWFNRYKNSFCDIKHMPEGQKSVAAFGFKNEIVTAVRQFIGSDKNPQFYAYFASYDWVLFIRLFGPMIDRPKHFPMWVVDLKQMMWERGLTAEWKREVCPDPADEHNALADAMWNMKLYSQILVHERKLIEQNPEAVLRIPGEQTRLKFPEKESKLKGKKNVS